MSHAPRENLFLLCANNNCVDQSEHMQSLTAAFVIG